MCKTSSATSNAVGMLRTTTGQPRCPQPTTSTHSNFLYGRSWSAVCGRARFDRGVPHTQRENSPVGGHAAAAMPNFQWVPKRETEFRLAVISFPTRFNTRSQQHKRGQRAFRRAGKRRITWLVISAVKPHGNHGVSVSRCKRWTSAACRVMPEKRI